LRRGVDEMVILNELTDAIFHPVRHKILMILKEKPSTVSEIVEKLNNMGISAEKRSVAFHIAILGGYKLINAPDEGTSTWRRVGEGHYEKVFRLNEDKLREQLDKAEKMIEELRGA